MKNGKVILYSLCFFLIAWFISGCSGDENKIVESRLNYNKSYDQNFENTSVENLSNNLTWPSSYLSYIAKILEKSNWTRVRVLLKDSSGINLSLVSTEDEKRNLILRLINKNLKIQSELIESLKPDEFRLDEPISNVGDGFSGDISKAGFKRLIKDSRVGGIMPSRKLIEPVDRKFTKCKHDEDCIHVQNGCCGYGSGGTATAISSEWQNFWERGLKNCGRIACAAIISDDISWFSKPKCINETCILVPDKDLICMEKFHVGCMKEFSEEQWWEVITWDRSCREFIEMCYDYRFSINGTIYPKGLVIELHLMRGEKIIGYAFPADTDGNYSFDYLPQGRYKLSFIRGGKEYKHQIIDLP